MARYHTGAPEDAGELDSAAAIASGKESQVRGAQQPHGGPAGGGAAGGTAAHGPMETIDEEQ